MVSGEVKRPTPTTGCAVSFLTKSMTGSWLPSGAKREGAQSVGEESSFTSHRSGRSASSATTSCASEGAASLGRARSSSRLMRSATAHLPPTASCVTSSSSRTMRTRLRTLPPYASVRRFHSGSRNSYGR